MKRKMKKLLAFLCVLTLGVGAVATGTSTKEVKAAEEATDSVTPVYLPGFKHVTLNNFYNNNYANAEDKMLKDGTYTGSKDLKYFITDDGKTAIDNFDNTLLSFRMKCETAGQTKTRLRIMTNDSWSNGLQIQKSNDGTSLQFVNNIGTSDTYLGTDNALSFSADDIGITDFGEAFILQLSIEYGDFPNTDIVVPDEITGNDIRIGIYFNGVLYDMNGDQVLNEEDKLTIRNCNSAKMGNCFTLTVSTGYSIDLYSVVPESQTRDVIPVCIDGFEPVTLNDFYNKNYSNAEDRIPQDKTYTSVMNYFLTEDGGTTTRSFDKTMFSVKMKSSSINHNARLHIAGINAYDGGFSLEKNADGSKLRFYDRNTLGESCNIAGTESRHYYFEPAKIATLDSFNDEFILQLSIEYGDFPKEEIVTSDETIGNDIRLGFYFNGEFYDFDGDGENTDADRITILNCDTAKIGSVFSIISTSNYSITLSSYVVEDEISKLTQLEWSDFSNSNQQPAEERAYMSGTDMYHMNKENISKLGATSFETNVLFTGSHTRGIYYGGANKDQGINLRPLASGNMAVLFSPVSSALSYVDGSAVGDGGTIYLYAATAGLTSFLDTEFKLNITTRYADYDGDGSADDMELGFFINDKLYDNRYMYLKDYTTYKTVGNCIYFNLSSPILMRSVPGVDEVSHQLSALTDTNGTYTTVTTDFVNVASVYSGDTQLENISEMKTPGDYEVRDAEGNAVGQVILYESNDTHPDGNVDVADLVAMLKVQNGIALSTWSGTMGAYAADFNETGIINSILGIETVSE